MEFTTKSSLGTPQRLTLYTPPMQRGEGIIDVHEGEHNLTIDAARFKPSITIPNWREELLALQLDAPIEPPAFRFTTTTSFHVQAIRNGQLRDLLPLSVVGVLITADNKIVLGLRGGRMAAGFAHFSPAGYVSLRNKDDPFFGTFFEELREEIGLMPADITSCALIGHEDDPTSKGVDFVIVAKTTESSTHIHAKHKVAFDEYRTAMERGVDEMQARKAIEAANMSNIDAWEHSDLLFVDDDLAAIQQVIDRYAITHNETVIPLVDACRGALMIYAEWKRQ